MIQSNNKKTLQIIVSTVIVLFSIFQIIAVIVAYMQQKMNFTNPLIPQGLLSGIRNFTIFVVIVYMIVIIGNLFSIYKKRYFYTAQIISFLLLLGFQFFYPEIIDFFWNTSF
ncbi:MAG: hypothetical protein PSV16_09075 [Flavobacterium sp.]|nr:hypothetical protein [Flavobacterium sp.]